MKRGICFRGKTWEHLTSVKNEEKVGAERPFFRGHVPAPIEKGDLGRLKEYRDYPGWLFIVDSQKASFCRIGYRLRDGYNRIS